VRAQTALAALFLAWATTALQAQSTLSGQVTVLTSTFPDRPRTPELRSRVFAKESVIAGPHVRFDVGGFAEGLLAGGTGAEHAGVAEFDEASVQLTLSRLDVLAGFTRAVWGRLDEIQPGDVVNPLDLSKFFYESREAARMPVGLVRARVHLAESANIELVAVPGFRQGRFDRLDEPSSPFNPTTVPLRVTVERPSGDVWDRMQGGGRLAASTGRVDWAVGAYRGFRPLQVYQLSYALSGIPAAPVVAIVVSGKYPRYTMVSGDFETALSRWTIRGEAVVSDDRAIQARGTPVIASGRTVQAGFGADRTIAGYRVLAELVAHHAMIDAPSLATDPLTAAPPRFDRRSLTAVGILERQFARETRLIRGFGIYDAVNKNGIARAVGAISPRENWWVEGTAVWFSGRRAGFLGPFVDDDFLSVRLTRRF
jgi:hypothetical protein